MAKPAQNEVRQAVLEAGVWELGTYTFASGKEANNKFFMERALENSQASRLLLGALGSLVMAHQPDVLWGVPTGGQKLAGLLARKYDLGYVRLRKIPGMQKAFAYESFEDEITVTRAQRLVGLEDITTELTSVVAALDVPGLQEKTAAVVAGWRRGTPDEEHFTGVPIEWTIEEAVPNIITPDHPFYQRYGALARHQVRAFYENRSV